MKKWFVLLVSIMAFFAFGITSGADGYKDTLRIGLSFGTSANGSGMFKSSSDITVYDGATYSYITTVPANTTINITNYAGSLSSEYFSGGNAVKLDSASPIYYNNKGYKGSFEIKSDVSGLTVINVVNTEDYVASVLGKEMSSSWPLEALKAQAVCARNYAFTIGNKHSANGFDLCATVDCQVYGGIESEAQSTRQAAEETRGITVLYNGKIVSLYYFSCDGGYTESSENVWVSSLGYLRGKQDIHESPEYATRYNWSKTYTKGEIETILYDKGIYIGSLLDITIDEVSENQSVMKMTFVGTAGSKTITKSQARTTLSLNSQAYTIQKNADSFVPQTDTSESYYVLSATGVSYIDKPMCYLTNYGLNYFEYTPVYTQPYAYDSYTFNGHGWGHRIGMSQWGAYSMAKSGYNFRDILNFYFTDIIIQENNNVTNTNGGQVIDPNVYTENTQWSDTGI